METLKNDKILVLAVDIDDDVGSAGVKTPVIGKENVLSAAQKFALSRPTDPDLNVIFTAVKIADELRKEGKDTEVVLISGHPDVGVKAGLRLREQINSVARSVGAFGAVVVADSSEDEKVLPIVESILPVLAVERVIVEQMRSVEETYLLLGRYLRKILEERRFSRIFLGLPGAIILTYVLLSVTPYGNYAWPAATTVLGLYLVLKGFGFMDEISKWWRASPITRFALVLSMISFVITAFMTYVTLTTYNYSLDAASIAIYMRTLMPYIVITVSPIIAARFSIRLLKRSPRVWRDIISFASLFVLYYFLDKIAALMLETQNLKQVIEVLNRSGLLNVFALYIGSLMVVAVALYALEKYV